MPPLAKAFVATKLSPLTWYEATRHTFASLSLITLFADVAQG